jgi:acetate kinase
LHNPASLAGIEAMQQSCPQVPQVAVFDTAFFRTLPPHAYRYALPDTLYQDHQVRRYGFHGTSHQHVAQKAAHYLQQPLTALRLITLHLGNGASVAAIRDGVCIDTSMGMTPVEGLIMGTRCGDLDPAVHFYLARTLGMDFDEIEHLLNTDSGMKGLCGVSDMRDVHHLADEGSEQARLAIAMYCYRIVKYIGAYYVALGGLDALVFTGGVGENDALIRQFVCDGVGVLGISVDEQRNHSGASETFRISEVNKKVDVLIVPANEELEIARQVVALLKKI